VSSSDDKPRVLKTDLLDELQSIKGLLVDEDTVIAGNNFTFETLDDDIDDGIFGGEPLDPDAEREWDHQLGRDQELDLDRELDIDIPILDDVVVATQNIDNAPGLLNIDEIFDRPATASFSTAADVSPPMAAQPTAEHRHNSTGPTASATGDRREPGSSAPTSPDLVFLIQELVDEFIPLIEDRLRSRLSELQPDILQELAEKHLNP